MTESQKATHGTRACGLADRQQAKRPRRVRGPLAREIAQVREGVEGACARKTPTTGMWRAARPKDEVGARPRLRGEPDAALAVDEQPAVEALVRLDMTARIGAAAPARGIWAQRAPRRTVLSRATVRR